MKIFWFELLLTATWQHGCQMISWEDNNIAYLTYEKKYCFGTHKVNIFFEKLRKEIFERYNYDKSTQNKYLTYHNISCLTRDRSNIYRVMSH